MNWVETPLYVRQDLFDSGHATGKNAAGVAVPDCWQTPWNTDPDVCYGDTFDLADAVQDQIDDLAMLRGNALTHTVLGTILAPPSGFFPACGYHDGAHTDDGFKSQLTVASGLRFNYAIALWLWYQFPSSPVRAVERTMPATAPTECRCQPNAAARIVCP